MSFNLLRRLRILLGRGKRAIYIVCEDATQYANLFSTFSMTFPYIYIYISVELNLSPKGIVGRTVSRKEPILKQMMFESSFGLAIFIHRINSYQ